MHMAVPLFAIFCVCRQNFTLAPYFDLVLALSATLLKPNGNVMARDVGHTNFQQNRGT
jgi:hypothetical protein